MSVIPMKLAAVAGPVRDFDDVALNSIIDRGFHPEPPASRADALRPFELENPYSETLRMAASAAEKLGITLGYHNPTDELSIAHSLASSRSASIVNCQLSFRAIEDRHTSIVAEREKLTRFIAEGEHILEQLMRLKDVNVELSEFFKVRYFKFRFGYMPRGVYDHHMPLVEERPDVYFFPTSVEEDAVYGMYLTPRKSAQTADALFEKLRFTRIRISDRVHGSGPQALGFIKTENEEAAARIAELDAELDALRRSEGPRLLAAYSYLKRMSDAYDVRRFAARTGQSFYILGWVPSDMAGEFTGNIAANCPNSVAVVDEPGADCPAPPVMLKNSRAAGAFQPFVEMYGVPGYNEIDPTPFLALTYALLFGAMFGDAGHGAVLAIGGFLLWRLKGAWLAQCAGWAGLSSVFFGLVYGSVFGSEEILPFGFKLHESHNVMGILRYSVAAGVAVIVTVMVLNVINGVRRSDFGSILFGPNGVAGAVFYLAVMAMFLPMIGFAEPILPARVLLIIAAPSFLLVFLREPLSKLVGQKQGGQEEHEREGVAGFIAGNFFEMVETLLSYVSNTLSYLRVGAYAISHASMMAAVYMIAEKPGGGYNIIALVIGNIIIMGVEAFLAGVQVLRLEFYEMFSRFHQGGGTPYAPVEVQYSITK